MRRGGGGRKERGGGGGGREMGREEGRNEGDVKERRSVIEDERMEEEGGGIKGMGGEERARVRGVMDGWRSEK